MKKEIIKAVVITLFAAGIVCFVLAMNMKKQDENAIHVPLATVEAFIEENEAP